MAKKRKNDPRGIGRAAGHADQHDRGIVAPPNGRRSTPRDIYELLDLIRRRPGIFLGGHAGSLPLLDVFLAGTMMPPMKPEQPPFADFRSWLPARIENVSDSHTMILRWLDEELGHERAFDAYFTYLDEFRANTVELLEAKAGSFTPRFTVVDESAPSVPTRLVVGRFSPSEIYFWGTESSAGLTKHFPFCHSVREARYLAAERWDAPGCTWRKLQPPERVRGEVSSGGLWHLLEQVRQRPGMYCDPTNRPLSTLETMLSGYDIALADHHVSDEGRGFNGALRAYLLVRFGWSTACGWADAIRQHLREGEDELGKFFSLVDELRTVVEDVSEDLHAVGARLSDLSHRLNGFRRRRREWIVTQLRASSWPPVLDGGRSR